jgi:hypothetical protein
MTLAISRPSGPTRLRLLCPGRGQGAEAESGAPAAGLLLAGVLLLGGADGVVLVVGEEDAEDDALALVEVGGVRVG